MGLTKYTPGESDNLALGQLGFTRIAGTTTIEGNFVAIKIVSATANFNTGTVVSIGDKPNVLDTFYNGDVLMGCFEAIQLNNGSDVVYAYMG